MGIRTTPLTIREIAEWAASQVLESDLTAETIRTVVSVECQRAKNGKLAERIAAAIVAAMPMGDPP